MDSDTQFYELSDTDLKSEQVLEDEISEIQESDFKRKYHEYLKTKRWKKFREEVFKVEGRKCLCCGSDTKFLNVHHISYKYIFKENEIHDECKDAYDPKYAYEEMIKDNFMVLCKYCHEAMHKSLNKFVSFNLHQINAVVDLSLSGDNGWEVLSSELDNLAIACYPFLCRANPYVKTKYTSFFFDMTNLKGDHLLNQLIRGKTGRDCVYNEFDYRCSKLLRENGNKTIDWGKLKHSEIIEHKKKIFSSIQFLINLENKLNIIELKENQNEIFSDLRFNCKELAKYVVRGKEDLSAYENLINYVNDLVTKNIIDISILEFITNILQVECSNYFYFKSSNKTLFITMVNSKYHLKILDKILVQDANYGQDTTK